MKEIWKDIPEYEGLYQVSNLGRVKSLNRFDRLGRLFKSRILKPNVDKDGYLRVGLSNVKREIIHIHRLVSKTFIPNLKNKPQVNHKNGIKTDNCVKNLEWVSCLENIRHKWKNGLQDVSYCSGVNNYRHKFSKEDVLFIRKNYKHRDKQFGVTALSKLFNVGHSLISNIISNKTYKNI